MEYTLKEFEEDIKKLKAEQIREKINGLPLSDEDKVKLNGIAIGIKLMLINKKSEKEINEALSKASTYFDRIAEATKPKGKTVKQKIQHSLETNYNHVTTVKYSGGLTRAELLIDVTLGEGKSQNKKYFYGPDSSKLLLGLTNEQKNAFQAYFGNKETRPKTVAELNVLFTLYGEGQDGHDFLKMFLDAYSKDPNLTLTAFLEKKNSLVKLLKDPNEFPLLQEAFKEPQSPQQQSTAEDIPQQAPVAGQVPVPHVECLPNGYENLDQLKNDLGRLQRFLTGLESLKESGVSTVTSGLDVLLPNIVDNILNSPIIKDEVKDELVNALIREELASHKIEEILTHLNNNSEKFLKESQSNEFEQKPEERKDQPNELSREDLAKLAGSMRDVTNVSLSTLSKEDRKAYIDNFVQLLEKTKDEIELVQERNKGVNSPSKWFKNVKDIEIKEVSYDADNDHFSVNVRLVRSTFVRKDADLIFKIPAKSVIDAYNKGGRLDLGYILYKLSLREPETSNSQLKIINPH